MPKGHRGLRGVEAQDIRGRGGGGQRAVHPRRVKAAQVPGQSRDGEALLHLPADDERREQGAPRQFELLGQRQDGRQDAGRAMTGRDALHLIVEAVQKHTVGERGGWRVGPQGRSRHGAMGTSSERLDVAFDVTCERFRRSGERVGHAIDDDGLRGRYGRVGKLLVRRRRGEFGQQPRRTGAGGSRRLGRRRSVLRFDHRPSRGRVHPMAIIHPERLWRR